MSGTWIPLNSPLCGRGVRRFLRRFFVSRCGFKMGVRHLQVMTQRHRLRIAQPSRHDVQRKPLGEFCLSTTAEILKCLLPYGQTRSANDPVHRLPKVLTDAVSVRQQIDGTRRDIVPNLVDRSADFRKQGNGPFILAVIILRLWAADAEPRIREINVLNLNAEFAENADPAVSRQHDDQP